MPESASSSTSITGSGASNQTIQAPAGGALVNSGSGVDNTLVGNTGDDTFVLQSATDTVQVAPGLGGVDTIVVNAFSYTLPANVQNLTVSGAYTYAQGNSLDNLITVGNDNGINVYGGGGNDVFVGGFGQDTFIVPGGGGNDVIYNWNAKDNVRLPGTGFTTFAQVQAAMTQVGPDVKLQVDANDVLIFRNTTVNQFTASNFLLKFDPASIGAPTFDAEFNQPPQIYNFTNNTGQWRTDWGFNWKSPADYTLVNNQEQEVYVTPGFQGGGQQALGLDPFSTSGGVLTITASQMTPDQQNAAWGQPIASGMLNTRGIFAQKYGYFEINAKLPAVAGAWPAFWLSDWKGSEADIGENLGGTPNVDYVRDYSPTMGQIQNALKTGDPNGFHTYGLLWTPTTLTYYYDGYAVMQSPTPTDWTNPMFMVVNLAFGGWSGAVPASSLPSSMQVAWVRAYNLPDGSAVVQHTTPAPPLGAIQLSGAATELAGSASYTDVKMLSTGALAVAAANALAGGSHTAIANEYDAGSGAQVGSTIGLQGWTPGGATMDPQITPLAGGYWEVTYAGSGAPSQIEIYNSAGTLIFQDNPFTQGTPSFTPMTNGGYVITNPAWSGRFADITAGGAWDWIPEQAVNGAQVTPSGVQALSNGGFAAWYQGSSEVDVYGTNGNLVSATQLGAPNSTFAMNTAPLPNGDFAVAWLSPTPGNPSSWELEFQTFTSAGAAITKATGAAVDLDPWHTQIKVLPTGQPDQAILFWSQGGGIWGVTATGSTVGTPTGIMVGSLSSVDATALSDGHIVMTWYQTDNGVQDLWAEVLDPKTMTGTKQALGPVDGGVHILATPGGGFAASWHVGGQIEARGYDGHGNYGPVTSVVGDFIGVDSAGRVVAVGSDGHGGALMQHYTVALTGV